MKKSFMLIMSIAICLFAFSLVAYNYVEQDKGHKTEEEGEWDALIIKAQKAYNDGKYHEGIALAEKAYQFAKKKFGDTHPITITSLDTLALLLKHQGRYNEAESLYKEALQLSEKVLGKEHTDTLRLLNNIATLYLELGRYGEAEPLYKEALQLRKKVLGKESPQTLVSMNNLAELYMSQGRYGEAEAMYKETLQLREKVLGKESPQTLTSINNLALLYYLQGRYNDAESLYKKVIELRKKVLGKEHPHTLTSIGNLAVLYKSQRRYSEAEPLYKEVFQLSQKSLGKEHPQTLKSMNNLAVFYATQNLYDESEPLYRDVLKVRKKVLGQEHPDTLNSIDNIAMLYEQQGRYSEAEPLYKEALQLSEKVMGKDHPNTLRFQTNYISLLVNMGKYSSAVYLVKQTEDRLLSRSFQELYTTSEEKIRRLFLKNISIFQNITFTLAALYPEAEYQKYAAEVLLRWKQVYADEHAFQHRLLTLSKDPEIIRLRQEMDKLRKEFSRKIHLTDFREELPRIGFHLNQAENELRDKARQLKPDLEVSSAGLDQVISRLPKESGQIEFRVFRYANFKTHESEKPHLAVYLLIPDSEVDKRIWFEDLGEIEDILQAYSESKMETLYKLLFSKFEDKISNLKKIYIAPDGFLNLVPFAALKLPDGRYFCQRQEINQLQTGRDLLASPVKSSSNLLVAIGGVDYGSMPEGKAENKSAEDTFKHLNMGASNELEGFENLENSIYETGTIVEIFKSNTKGDTPKGDAVFFSKSESTEKNLKNIPSPPRILHLSTHGFYLQNAELTDWAEEAPLLLSGLALSGANEGLQGKLDTNGDDGLLYSMEVLGLNLQGTELVSLSACDTGKGVVDYSEGVYGLVRAFRTAGAQSVLMTLWPVGDESSRVFMESFYDTWLSSENLTPAEALHKTRLLFIENPPKPGYDNPAVWSPYVLIGR